MFVFVFLILMCFSVLKGNEFISYLFSLPQTVTYKIQWLDTPPFSHFMRIAHVTEAPSTGAPLFKKAEETQITIKNYWLASTLS